jgi:hypothetical protein
MIKRLRSSETGTAIVTAIALMTAMLGTGLAAYSFSDTQQTESRRVRERESSFNYAEALLNTQAYVLSRNWAGSTPYQDCSEASAPVQFCPQPAQLAASYGTADFSAGVQWRTQVRDDDGTPRYSAAVLNRPAWDQNGNNRVWIRSESRVRDRARGMVALVEVQEDREEFPRRVIIAGRFTLTPNGNHAYVKTNPDQTSPHPVTVRCDAPPNPNQGDQCMGYTPDRRRPQIDPDYATEDNYPGQRAIDDAMLERLRERAVSEGTYFSGCPTDAQLTGKVVWVSGCASGQYTGGDWNTSTNPGMLIWESGTLRLGGNGTFWGIVYHLNGYPTVSSNAGNVLELRGGLTIEGGAFVDGPGGIDVGSNKVNVNFNGLAFDSVSTFGNAALVQNSFRELGAGSLILGG